MSFKILLKVQYPYKLLPDGNSKMCNFKRMLIPKLAYNLLSVSEASDAGKIVKFDESGCRILRDVHCFCYQNGKSILPQFL